MKLITKTLAASVLGAGILAASAMSASAAVVCSGNVCWHTHEAHDYPPEATESMTKIGGGARLKNSHSVSVKAAVTGVGRAG
jgi:hypothetical protein